MILQISSLPTAKLRFSDAFAGSVRERVVFTSYNWLIPSVDDVGKHYRYPAVTGN